ncbi:MAG: hypothetical protein JNJ41_15170 [Bacteroidia bacterium]|nr:hypothetical protein [Bacteroidia bacterium]
MKFFYIFLTIIMLCFSACKKAHKYSEDPKKTRDSPKQRLLGIWNIYEYTLNGNSILNPANFGGNDVTSYFRLQYRNDYTELIEPFEDEAYLTFGPFSNSANCGYIMCFITPLKCTNTSQKTNWCITKLYDNDLNLTLKTDTGEFKIFFKKTHN